MLPVFEGHANGIAKIDASRQGQSNELTLGFQVYLRRFRRRLDPGAGMPAHYSSRVDFLDQSNPPKKLLADALIELNKPVDFTDPQSGRTYRFFQSSFDGPYLPGEAEFNKLVGNARSHDQVYRSYLSVNYDPGRWLKYVGGVLVLLGIIIVYYFRTSTPNKPLAVSHAPPTNNSPLQILLVAAILLFLVGNARADNAPLDWSTWQHLPAFGEGRVEPLDTFARETVEAICGRPNPTLLSPDDSPSGKLREFGAAELLFAWLAEPEKWEDVPFLPADDEQLRLDIGLPLQDAQGRRLRYVSPRYLKQSPAIRNRLTETIRRAEAEGKDFQLTDLEKKLDHVFDTYSIYRAVTRDPRLPSIASERFNNRKDLAKDALLRLVGDSYMAEKIGSEPKTGADVVKTAEAWQKLLGAMSQGTLSLKKIEPAVTEFQQAADRLAARLASPDDAVLTALAADFRHQVTEMHLALYDDGSTLRLIPALDAGRARGESPTRRRRLALAQLPGDNVRLRRPLESVSAARAKQCSQGVCRRESRLYRSQVRRSARAIRRRNGPFRRIASHIGRARSSRCAGSFPSDTATSS